jgi:hypothetical protein
MSIKDEKNVLMCLYGQDRSVSANMLARVKGYNTRIFPGGKWELCQHSNERIQQEIDPDEKVVIIDDSHTGWELDGKATKATQRLLDQAGRKHRTVTHRELLEEIAYGPNMRNL